MPLSRWLPHRHSAGVGGSAPSVTASFDNGSQIGPRVDRTPGQLHKRSSDSSIQPRSQALQPPISSVRDTTPRLCVTELRVDGDGHLPLSAAPSPGFTEVKPNAREPHVFENEFVRGKLLLLLNPTALPPGTTASNSIDTATRVEMFNGKQRLFWVQLQLQFKQAPPPNCELYIGGEVPRAMRLGSSTEGGCHLLLSVLRSLVRGLHISFGEAQSDTETAGDDAELPHISFPLVAAVDQFVCTPAGQTPPVLGSTDFGETTEQAKQRRRAGANVYIFNTEDTYSFHFHSYYLDFARWQVTNVPGMKPTDLCAFWEDMPLHLVAYFVKPMEDPVSSRHSRQAKCYQFGFQLTHAVARPSPTAAKALGLLHSGQAVAPPESTHRLSGVKFSLFVKSGDVTARLEEIQRRLARYEVHAPAWFEYLSCSRTHRQRRVGYVIVFREVVDEPSTETGSSASSPSRKTKHERLLLLPALVAFAPLTFLEHDGNRSPSRKASTGIFALLSLSVRSSRGKFETIENERQVLDYHLQRLAATTSESDGGSDNSNSNSNSTASDFSNCGLPQLEQLCAAQNALLMMLESPPSSTTLESEWAFLSANEAGLTGPSSAFPFSSTSVLSPGRDLEQRGSAILQCGAVHVVRVLSKSQWRHEWLVLDNASRTLRFTRMLSSSNLSKFALPLDNVLSVSTREPTFRRCFCSASITDESPELLHDSLHWLHIGLLTRCQHIAFASSEQRQPWLVLLTRLSTRARLPSSAMMATLGGFGGKRIVLNDRNAMHLPVPDSTTDCLLLATSCALDRPLDLVASALKCGLELSSKRREAFADDGTVDASFAHDLLAFADAVQLLQRADLSSLVRREKRKRVFFLNLYHLVLIHASLLGLRPKSKSQWGRFFNGVSYRLGMTDRGDVDMRFSLAEIEHGVLRAAMTPLRLPLAFLVIPQFDPESNDPRVLLTLRKPDFRLNFALNCMTFSCSECVPIYTVARLDAQLNEATRQVVEPVLRFDHDERTVYLPKVCDWYAGDFGFEDDVLPTATQNELGNASLGVLLPYGRLEDATMLEYAYGHPHALVSAYEYVAYDFRFRESLALDQTQPSTRSYEPFHR